MQANITTTRAERQPDEDRDEREFDRQPVVELVDHVGAVARGDRRQTGDRNLVSPDALADRRSSAASRLSTTGRIWLESRSGTRPDTTTASWSAEMKRRTRCSGITLTYSFKVATSELPAFSASQRRSVSSDQTLPTPAWLLHHRMNVGDGLQGFRRVQRGTLGEFDQHVDRIGAGQLGVETPAGRHRLLLVGHLIGQPVTRLEIGVDHAETADEDHRDQAEQPGTADHAHRDPVAEIAQRVDAGIGALEFGRETFSLRTSNTPNTGTSDSTAISAMMVAASPASPNLRIRSESENCSAMNDMPAVAWVSTQAGPTTSTALLERGVFVLPRRSAGRAPQRSAASNRRN